MNEILVIARSALPPQWLPEEGAVALAWESLGAVLERNPGALRWMPRSQAEVAPCWKQPIPYLVLRDAEGCVAAYRRGGSERRLHGRWSVGIGGHVERADANGDFASTLLQCAMRELAEEAPGCVANLRFAGAINEECTEVGTVHWASCSRSTSRIDPHPAPSSASSPG